MPHVSTRTRRTAAWAATLALAAGTLVVGRIVHAQRPVPAADPKFPRIRFADSLTSVNDHCIVSQIKLNPRVRPIYVNGQPIGFC